MPPHSSPWSPPNHRTANRLALDRMILRRRPHHPPHPKEFRSATRRWWSCATPRPPPVTARSRRRGSSASTRPRTPPNAGPTAAAGRVGCGERAVRGEPRPARTLRRAGAGADADLARGGHPAHRLRRDPPYPRRQPPARPGRGAAQLLAVLRGVHRHRGRGGLRQVPRAVDGARGQRDQHGGPRPAPLRRLRPRGVHEGEVPPGLRAHVRPAPARRGASRLARRAGHAAVREAGREGLRVHRGQRLGAPEVVLARRAGGGARVPPQQRLRGRRGGVPGGARAGGGCWTCRASRSTRWPVPGPRRT